MIQILNSLNEKRHSQLTTSSVKPTVPQPTMTAYSSSENTPICHFALQSVHYFTLPTIPEPIFSSPFANLRKLVSALAMRTTVLSSGFLATCDDVHIMHSNSTLTVLPIPFMNYVANIAYHFPTSSSSPMPAGKTAQTLDDLPLAT
jgi:hypothetical protein